MTSNYIKFPSLSFRMVCVFMFFFENEESVRKVECFSALAPFLSNCSVMIGKFKAFFREQHPILPDESN